MSYLHNVAYILHGNLKPEMCLSAMPTMVSSQTLRDLQSLNSALVGTSTLCQRMHSAIFHLAARFCAGFRNGRRSFRHGFRLHLILCDCAREPSPAAERDANGDHLDFEEGDQNGGLSVRVDAGSTNGESFDSGDQGDQNGELSTGADGEDGTRAVEHSVTTDQENNTAKILLTGEGDVYAFGMLMWTLWTLQPPIGDFDELTAIFQGSRPEVPCTMPPAMVDLMHACGSHDPGNRPKFHDVTVLIGDILKDVSGQMALFLLRKISLFDLHFPMMISKGQRRRCFISK
ncbi:hypothetical protein M427DRAFT_288857 [Gonapodya prolifera JEL478]|uniref:Protein kinase domain-containing protein n=1 Tax=Gonapodya prolifera (strain JEL478) TaxID=1344416 RepID=A0A139AIN0_GONPJ|nr:hypothetical protein M427DRAFT_288857 [Gonapodya prolifera JEL478]|eukprot:KXS16661.1 hypothetical protein M427DRAFT_288857 [Gonapodya prolifera JEL478]